MSEENNPTTNPYVASDGFTYLEGQRRCVSCGEYKDAYVRDTGGKVVSSGEFYIGRHLPGGFQINCKACSKSRSSSRTHLDRLKDVRAKKAKMRREAQVGGLAAEYKVAEHPDRSTYNTSTVVGILKKTRYSDIYEMADDVGMTYPGLLRLQKHGCPKRMGKGAIKVAKEALSLYKILKEEDPEYASVFLAIIRHEGWPTPGTRPEDAADLGFAPKEQSED